VWFGGWRNFILRAKAFYFLQSESFDLARITTREQTANAGKIMLDKTTGA